MNHDDRRNVEQAIADAANWYEQMQNLATRMLSKPETVQIGQELLLASGGFGDAKMHLQVVGKMTPGTKTHEDGISSLMAAALEPKEES